MLLAFFTIKWLQVFKYLKFNENVSLLKLFFLVDFKIVKVKSKKY